MNRGVSRRSITSLREMTFCLATPTLVSAVTARAVARHVVKLSGRRNFTVARPSFPVTALGFPVRCVFEVLANHRLDHVAFVFEVGQLVRRLGTGKVDRLFPRVTSERV